MAKITLDRLNGALTGKEPRHQPDWTFIAVPQVDFGKVAAGASVVELYGPPALRGTQTDFTADALWCGLQLHGSGQAPGLHLGPDGLRVTVI